MKGNSKPFGYVPATDECKHYGTRVVVAASMIGNKISMPESKGTVHRIFNEGSLLEVQIDGRDFASRFDGSKITIVESE